MSSPSPCEQSTLTGCACSEFALTENVSSAVMDEWPILKRNKYVQMGVVGAVCMVMFLLSLPTITQVYCRYARAEHTVSSSRPFLSTMTPRVQGGLVAFQVFDNHSCGWGVMIIGAVECLTVSWVYGWDNIKS